MYPTIVIILVNTQQSMVEKYGFTTVFQGSKGLNLNFQDVEARAAAMGHVSFTESAMETKVHVDLPDLMEIKQESRENK